MLIEVLEVSKPEWKKKGTNKWQELVVSYTDDKGGPYKRTFRSFAEPDVFKALVSATAGEHFNVKVVKEGDFWQWKSAEKVDKPVASNTVGKNVSPYMNRDLLEREKFEYDKDVRQVFIIRQSSLSNAVAFHGGTKNAGVTVDKILETAQKFVNFVTEELSNNVPQENNTDNDSESVVETIE